MIQYSKLFTCSCFCDKRVDVQLNEFIKEHPNYTIDKVNLSNNENGQMLFVVFKIKE